jgi:hypothetical protein
MLGFRSALARLYYQHGTRSSQTPARSDPAGEADRQYRERAGGDAIAMSGVEDWEARRTQASLIGYSA